MPTNNITSASTSTVESHDGRIEATRAAEGGLAVSLELLLAHA